MPRERTRRTNKLAVRRRWGSASRWRSRTTAVGRDRRRGTLDSLATIGVKQPKNLAIVCLDNGHYSASGVQPSATKAGVDLAEAARACPCRVRDIGLNLAAHLIPFPRGGSRGRSERAAGEGQRGRSSSVLASASFRSDSLGALTCPGCVVCAARARPRSESLCYSVVAPTGDPGSYQSNNGPPGLSTCPRQR